MKKSVDIFVDTPFLGSIFMFLLWNMCFPYIYTPKKSCAVIGGVEKTGDNILILLINNPLQGSVYIFVYIFYQRFNNTKKDINHEG